MELHATKTPTKPAVVFEGQSLNWQQLSQAVGRLSGYFSEKLGFHEQRVVALLITNSPEFIIAHLAVVKAGHIVMPLDPAYKKLELDAIVEQMSPSMIISSRRYVEQLSHTDINIALIEELLTQDFAAAKSLRLPAHQQIASLTFTSGTSGKPKAVPNTHANHIWNIEVCSQVWEWNEKDTMLLTLPLSHWYGLVMGLSGVLYHGNTLYLHQQAFNPDEMLEELASGRISLFTHAPLGYMKMLAYKPNKKYDLSKVRLLISGSAPLPPAVWRQFKERFGVEIIETYGSSETGRIAANTLRKHQLGTPGKILPGVEFKFGAESEVLVKSGGLFPGYWHNNEATRAAKTADGFWHTGDIGELKDGYLFLKGRFQEKIRRFGYSVSPRDIEWAMHQNPRVQEIYVMGRQQTDKNDELVFFIVSDLSDAELSDYCKQNLLFAWRPDRIIHLDHLPRTRSGKPKIGELKTMAV